MRDQKVRKAFSRAAVTYDQFAGWHRQIGLDLIQQLEILAPEQPDVILDIGMGTGWLTHQLVRAFPQSMVVGIDFAEGMMVYARHNHPGTRLVQADASSLPFQEKTFDWIVSNLAYQWVDELPLAMGECARVIKPGGMLGITLFGRRTLDELFTSLQHALDPLGRRDAACFKRLAGSEEAAAAIGQNGFQSLVVETALKTVTFPDMPALLRWIKGMGAQGLRHDVFMGRDLLRRAGDYYNRHFKDGSGIYATLEVIRICAKKISTGYK